MPARRNLKLPSPRDATIFRRVVIHGERQSDVAREFGLTKQRVFAICERLRKLAFLELNEDFSKHRRQTLLRLEHVHCEALNAWEHSKRGRGSNTETVNSAGAIVRSTTRNDSFGNPRFLAEARLALADIRQLCGIDAQKTDVLELRTARTLRVELEALPTAELEQIAQLARWEQNHVIRLVDAEAPGMGEGSIMFEPSCLP